MDWHAVADTSLPSPTHFQRLSRLHGGILAGVRDADSGASAGANLGSGLNILDDSLTASLNQLTRYLLELF